LKPLAAMPLLIEAASVSRYFAGGRGLLPRRKRLVRAVDGIDLEIRTGETLGLVGESGSGKSTLGRVLVGALPASAGTIRFANEDVTRPTRARWYALRRDMQLIQQNPGAALDPRLMIADQLIEALDIHAIGSRATRRDAAAGMLTRVGLASDVMRRFPHELSGGQQQRVAIARALLVRPRFVVCDEPVSALDLSVQAQVLNLLRDLQAEFGLTYLFVSHDLGVIRYLCHRIAVLYLGRIVEIGPRNQVLGGPLHPYTHALLASVPVADPNTPPPAPQISGEPPDPASPPPGCRFHTRCIRATEICRRAEPTLSAIGGGAGTHQVACHHAGDESSVRGAA
jgi:peptide/nickel transport system ATP-binding protein